jgi:adenosylcobyric acid synthase
MEKLRPLMFVGTGSDVGKSVINAAFCRIFKQDGLTPAPFKAQNMSLNSYATPDGLEIGRAQAMQAEACKLECNSDMNPVLLKPVSYLSSQVVLHGKPIGNRTASEYFMETDRDWLFNEALGAYHRLEANYNPIVLEGAGSISEINLWDKDITNMRMAVETNAAVILVADIDRGGVFGSVYGTLQLLPEKERKLIKGILINKFRGDIALFEKGREMLETLTGVHVVGVVPWFNDIYIDDEDSVVIDSKQQRANETKVNIAVVLLRHMSNFTDFNYLERLQEIHFFYTANPEDLQKADIIIIPGSKNTISDMMYLRSSGMAKALLLAHNSGKAVYGVCGGFQMMGKEIRDPYNVEGTIEMMPGLGILPVVTTITKEKTTEQCDFRFLDEPDICKGYEIHMGETQSEIESPLCEIAGAKKDGYFLSPKTWGTYIHGIFDNEVVVKNILRNAGMHSDLSINDYQSFKEEQYNKLAQHVRDNVDVEYVYQVLTWK